MTTSISLGIQAEASRIIEQSDQPSLHLGELLNEFLNRFLVWPYRASPGQAVDTKGAESAAFDALFYTSSEDLTQVPADNLACAIDVHQSLGLEELRASYEKIAQAKQLRKSPPPKTPSRVPVADATMGIIFSVDSVVPLEKLAEELEQLNGKHSYHHWVDMVVVLRWRVNGPWANSPARLAAGTEKPRMMGPFLFGPPLSAALVSGGHLRLFL